MDQNIFKAPRTEGETDLIAEVRELIMTSGCGLNIVEAFDNDYCILDAKPLGPEAQRFLLNRYLYRQITACGAPSMEERFCLVESGQIRDWLRLFKQKILPFMMVNQLPKPIDHE
jgi:hypothetical protein